MQKQHSNKVISYLYLEEIFYLLILKESTSFCSHIKLSKQNIFKKMMLFLLTTVESNHFQRCQVILTKLTIMIDLTKFPSKICRSNIGYGINIKFENINKQHLIRLKIKKQLLAIQQLVFLIELNQFDTKMQKNYNIEKQIQYRVQILRQFRSYNKYLLKRDMKAIIYLVLATLIVSLVHSAIISMNTAKTKNPTDPATKSAAAIDIKYENSNAKMWAYNGLVCRTRLATYSDYQSNGVTLPNIKTYSQGLYTNVIPPSCPVGTYDNYQTMSYRLGFKDNSEGLQYFVQFDARQNSLISNQQYIISDITLAPNGTQILNAKTPKFTIGPAGSLDVIYESID